METNDLGSKKINGVQKNIDESKGKNVSHDKNLKDPNLKREIVTDADGDKKIVERARNENEDIPKKIPKVSNDNPNSNRGVKTEEEAQSDLQYNLNLFCKDLFSLKPEQRIAELKKMGWYNDKLFRKQFSSAFVDENGVLQNFDFPTEVKKTSTELEAA